jgi:hypothetical protein
VSSRPAFQPQALGSTRGIVRNRSLAAARYFNEEELFLISEMALTEEANCGAFVLLFSAYGYVFRIADYSFTWTVLCYLHKKISTFRAFSNRRSCASRIAFSILPSQAVL